MTGREQDSQGIASSLALRELTSQSCSLDWTRPAAVPRGLRDIVLPGSGDPRAQTIVDVTHDTRGHAHDERARRNAHPLRDHGSRRDHAARSHMHIVEQDRSHPDQALVFHNTGVQDHPVPHTHPSTDQGGLSFIYMHDGGVLQVGGLPDDDRRHVAAQDRLVPHTRARSQRHVAHHDGAGRYERGRIDLGLFVDYCRTGWKGHWTHASVGSPFF